MSIADVIRGNLSEIGCGRKTLTITGHSMGAAMAMLAMIDLKNHGYQMAPTYNFGSPRVGNAALAAVLDTSFDVFRITHNKDPAPHMPPVVTPFMHTATEIFYDGNFTGGNYTIGDSTGEDPNGSNRYAGLTDMPAMALSSSKHLEYFYDVTGFRMDGESCSDLEVLNVVVA